MFEKYVGFVEFNNWEVFCGYDQGHVCGLLWSVMVREMKGVIGCMVTERWKGDEVVMCCLENQE